MGWWTDPVGSGRSGKKSSWWTEPVGGRRSSEKPTRKAARQKVNKCEICRKPFGRCRCAMPEVRAVKTKKKVEDKNGQQKTVSVKTGWSVDANGVDWCDTCNSRVWKGKCMNYQCSTRR